MTEIFVMRDRINRFVKEYETWFLIIAKFIGMMFVSVVSIHSLDILKF